MNVLRALCDFCRRIIGQPVVPRSEEHTSELQSQSNLVCRLLLEKKTTIYFDSLTVNAGNGGFLHCIQMDTSVNAANQVVSVGAAIAFDADPKFFACLVRFESSSVPTTRPTAYDVYPFFFFYDGGYHRVLHSFPPGALPD